MAAASKRPFDHQALLDHLDAHLSVFPSGYVMDVLSGAAVSLVVGGVCGWFCRKR